MKQSPVLILALFATFFRSSICQQIPLNEFRCTQAGFVPDPDNKHVFHECVRHPVNPSTLISYTFDCGYIECFDKEHLHKCSLKACSRNGTGSDDLSCLKNQLRQDAKIICQEETLTIMEEQLPTMIDFTAHRGDAFQNLRLSLRDVNLHMRQNYKLLIENVGKNVLPLMVATDGEPDYAGVGGVYKIYLKDGSMRRIIPVGPAFEINKCLSHMLMGIYAIISPYFHSPNSINWQSSLRSFQQTVKNVEYLLKNEDMDLPAEERILAFTITTKTIDYIDKAIKANSVDISTFKSYANDLAPFIDKAMQRAAKAHAEDTIPALLKLKEEMGEVEWRKMHVIIPTTWPVSLWNIRLHALQKVMSFEQIEKQVLITEGATTEADAKTTLGRVVADRAVAQLIWGGLNDDTSRDHIYSLSTRRDLLTSPASAQLNQVCQKLEEEPSKSPCPYSGRTANIETDNDHTINGHPELFATMLRH